MNNKMACPINAQVSLGQERVSRPFLILQVPQYIMVPEIGLWCDNFACVINNSLGTSTYHHVNKTAKYAWPSIPSSERNTYEQNRP